MKRAELASGRLGRVLIRTGIGRRVCNSVLRRCNHGETRLQNFREVESGNFCLAGKMINSGLTPAAEELLARVAEGECQSEKQTERPTRERDILGAELFA